MIKFGVGQPVTRLEDARLLRGQGRYQDDTNLPGQLHAVFLRSPHAHARIRSIEKSAATAAPGVKAIYTGADYAADGLAMPKPTRHGRTHRGSGTRTQTTSPTPMKGATRPRPKPPSPAPITSSDGVM